MLTILTTASSVARALWVFGEDALAERAEKLDRGTVDRISAVAVHHHFYDGTAYDMSLALAAVEVLERKPRELARRRRRRQPDTP